MSPAAGAPTSAADALAGRRIVVTRAAEQAGELRRELEARGAVAITCPTIRLERPDSWAEVDGALGRIEGYDWVVFTSANGVRFVLERWRLRGRAAHELAGVRFAVVGPRTAEALARHGVEAAFVAPDSGSVPLAESLPSVDAANILMARSDRSDPASSGILRGRGARNVDEVVAYRTVPVAPSGPVLELLRRGIDGITFTSPSTVHGFLAMGPEWRRLSAGAIVASLGPATTAAARQAGLDVHQATEKTMSGLAAALSDAFARRAAADMQAAEPAREEAQ